MERVLQEKLQELKDKNLLRVPKGSAVEGFINFTSNDYLGLRSNAEVIEAGIEASRQYGAGAGASRIAGGNYELIDQFAAKVAGYKGYPAATLFGSGYLANIGVISALQPAVVYADKFVHASIIDGVKLSGAKLVRFKHNDYLDLRRRVDKPGLIISEEIFSMDGDRADVKQLREIADACGCQLMIDGAHSLYDKRSANAADIYVGTMSKALGSYGGYVCGSKTLIKFLAARARSLIYSTALPPFAVGAAIKSLEIIKRDRPYLKTLDNVSYFASALGLPANPKSAIIPFVLGSEERALAVEKALLDKKILVSAMRPPTVSPGTSRLRISITAVHSKSEIDLLAESLKTIV